MSECVRELGGEGASGGGGKWQGARMTRPAAEGLKPEISQHVWVDNIVTRRGEGWERRET